MYSGDSASRFDACRIFGQREPGTLPLRRSSPLIDACEAMKRCASSDSDISSENSATACLESSAAFSAKLAIRPIFPIDGPRGEDDQVAGLEAAGDDVEVVEAGGGAGDRLALAREMLELVELGRQEVVDRAEVLAGVLVGDLEDRALGHVDEIARERLVAVHARLDLVRRAEQPPEHRVVTDDARVLADVADGGDRAGQQVDRGAAADRHPGRPPA